MKSPIWFLTVISILLADGRGAYAEDSVGDPSTEIASRSRDSVVVILSTGRQGTREGLGTGFIVRSDGVVATNFHVIGEHRRFSIQLANGDIHDPTAILGYDRKRDLALVKIDVHDLQALELGDSGTLRAGQTVMAIGNPLGLEYSVTRGVVAAPSRTVGTDAHMREMIQIGIPIEPGSSGSPVLNLEGFVVGILAMKSSDAFGFAEPVNHLKEVLANERKISMAAWLTIGTLDPRDWKPLSGGTWRQRGGAIVAEGLGDGFAGRMLCLSGLSCPEGEKFGLEVEVRLDDESGAAGLAFHSDGGFKHYGFYSTNGALRLTRFEGPNIFTWKILETVDSTAYRPNDWNRLGVQVDGPRITCFVNDEVVIEQEDHALRVGQLGLVKFRAPSANFRQFRVAEKLDSGSAVDEIRSEFNRIVDSAGSVLDEEALVEPIAELGPHAVALLKARASLKEREARQLRNLAIRVHQQIVEKQLADLMADGDGKIDLLRGALLIAWLDNPDLDVVAYERLVERMADDVRERVSESKASSVEMRMATLVRFMFDEQGFHASVADYYHRSNSYINEVLDDKEGIPITLSLVFIELARRLELDVSGMNTPRHFLVRHDVPDGPVRYLDVFDSAREISRTEIAALSGVAIVEDADLKPAKNAAVLARVLRNLLSIAERESDGASVMRYLDAIITIRPDSAVDRWIRAMHLFHTHNYRRAAIDLDWLLQNTPEGLDLKPVQDRRDAIREKLGGQ